MKSLSLRSMVIPLSECAKVRENANLYEAVLALDEAQKKQKSFYKFKALLVVNENEEVVGKINPRDLIIGIEDNYRKVGDLRSASHTGFTREFINMMIERNRLWQDPLKDICKKAARHTVEAVMDKPTPGEYLEEDDSLVEAIHRLVLGHYPYVLVTKDGKTTGILRTEDIFKMLCDEIKSCDVS